MSKYDKVANQNRLAAVLLRKLHQAVVKAIDVNPYTRLGEVMKEVDHFLSVVDNEPAVGNREAPRKLHEAPAPTKADLKKYTQFVVTGRSQYDDQPLPEGTQIWLPYANKWSDLTAFDEKVAGQVIRKDIETWFHVTLRVPVNA